MVSQMGFTVVVFVILATAGPTIATATAVAASFISTTAGMDHMLHDAALVMVCADSISQLSGPCCVVVFFGTEDGRIIFLCRVHERPYARDCAWIWLTILRVPLRQVWQLAARWIEHQYNLHRG
jgi:hypothetical protein